MRMTCIGKEETADGSPENRVYFYASYLMPGEGSLGIFHVSPEEVKRYGVGCVYEYDGKGLPEPL